jgi:hypothetical protein
VPGEQSKARGKASRGRSPRTTPSRTPSAAPASCGRLDAPLPTRTRARSRSNVPSRCTSRVPKRHATAMLPAYLAHHAATADHLERSSCRRAAAAHQRSFPAWRVLRCCGRTEKRSSATVAAHLMTERNQSKRSASTASGSRSRADALRLSAPGSGSGRAAFLVFPPAPGDGEATWEVPFGRQSATPSALGGWPLPCHGGWALNHPCVPPWEKRGRREGARRCRRENQPRRRHPPAGTEHLRPSSSPHRPLPPPESTAVAPHPPGSSASALLDGRRRRLEVGSMAVSSRRRRCLPAPAPPPWPRPLLLPPRRPPALGLRTFELLPSRSPPAGAPPRLCCFGSLHGDRRVGSSRVGGTGWGEGMERDGRGRWGKISESNMWVHILVVGLEFEIQRSTGARKLVAN